MKITYIDKLKNAIGFFIISCFIIFVTFLCSSCQFDKFDKPVSSAIEGIAGQTTVKNIIKTGLWPIGNCMYIKGGGWNEDMTGGGNETKSLGLSSQWKEFYDANAKIVSKETANEYNSNYGRAYRQYGLNESAYLGWVLHNVFNDGEDYVFRLSTYTKALENRGFGHEVESNNVRAQRPGDIVLCKSYDLVYITLGACEDGSVLYLCSTYPAVMIVGSTTPSGDTNSIAHKLATDYVNKYYPDAVVVSKSEPVDYQKLIECKELNWNDSITDPDGYRNKKPDDILKDIFGE